MISATRIDFISQFLDSSSSEDEFEAFFSDNSDEDVSSSSDDDNVPLDARLERRVVLWQVNTLRLADVFGTNDDHNQWRKFLYCVQAAHYLNMDVSYCDALSPSNQLCSFLFGGSRR